MKNALTIFLIMLSVNVYAIQWCNDKHVDGISISLNGEIAYKVNRKDNSFKRLYRVMTQFITIKYEYQGNEEEYNPSWAESSGGINQGC